MERKAGPLTMYGTPAQLATIEWPWVADHLRRAGAYWLTVPTSGHPHPRPVWGLWHRDLLQLSIGSPALRAGATRRAPVTVHLGDVTDVVIVEGAVAGTTDEIGVLEAYNNKYDWNYTVAEYGPLTTVEPVKVMAWRSAGWAGRDGFEAAGRWRAPPRTG